MSERVLIATAIELACPLITYDARIARFSASHLAAQYGFLIWAGYGLSRYGGVQNPARGDHAAGLRGRLVSIIHSYRMSGVITRKTRVVSSFVPRFLRYLRARHGMATMGFYLMSECLRTIPAGKSLKSRTSGITR